MDIAPGLRDLRTERGWSQDALARRAVTSKQTVQNVESGRTKNPDLKTIAALATGFGMTVWDFIRECLERGDKGENLSFSWAA